MTDNNYAVILAGGEGTRFWPLSRRHFPKQFLRIIHENSLLESTVKRACQIVSSKNIFIATNALYMNEAKKQVKAFGVPAENIILEPSPKNTLPAIALCAWVISQRDLKANILVFPSDHFIKGDMLFKRAMRSGLELAKNGYLCLFGIKPNILKLGYGYIQASRKIKRDVFSIARFIEKPDLYKARKLLKKKNIFWNSGIFCFNAEVILGETKIFAPKIYRQILSLETKKISPQIWGGIVPASIDYAVLEKSSRLVMVEAKFFWSDLGSWDALSDLLPKDNRNNVVLSDCNSVSLDSSNTLLCSYEHKRLIAAVGLKDLIIVDTPDALLVCRKDKAQDVKKLVDILKRKNITYV